MAQKLKPISKQTIVITGASSGIGLATARRAAGEGARVVLVSRNEDALGEAVHSIEVRGGKAAHIALDIADKDAAERIGDFAADRFGGFDTWVNDAAATMYARLDETTMEEHRRLFDVGYFGLVQCSLYAARALRHRGGALINVGSVLSERAVPIQGAYAAMKHAVRGFTDALRMEIEMDGSPVSVTLIKPNGIDTPYSEHARNKMDQPARVPPIVYDPELVAKAICFAAENRKRELTVGGGGLFITKMGNAMPRTMDRMMEAFLGEQTQSIDTPPRPGSNDNLFASRQDGHERSNQDIYVRRQSFALEAQMRPWTAAAIVGGIAAATAAAYLSVRRRNADYGFWDESEIAGAHQADGTDSSDSFAAGIADEGTVPEGDLDEDVVVEGVVIVER